MSKQNLQNWVSIGLLTFLFTPMTAQQPNVLLIMADDLGFSDLGCYGGEISTPNLNQLAENGLRFTQFYNTGRCWPTRGALLTGYYAQQIRRDKMPGVEVGKRPSWAKLLPERLKPLGYRSYHSGKWHVDGLPIENGFDQSYYLKDQGRFFYPKLHYKNDVELPAVKPGSNYYATTAIADHAIECLQTHSKQFSDQPFFHFLAFTAPHFPLHAHQEDIALYKKKYKRDWQKIRRKRYKRQVQMGIISHKLSKVEPEVGPPYHFPKALEILGTGEVNRPIPWKDLTREQREFQGDKMAIHAAMIHRMDRDIGRVINQLKEMRAYDNTLIIFLSDNGASAEIMVRADGHDPYALPGSAASYLCLGPSCSTTSNTPFRRHKTWVHEGGIATPFIVHWPQGISSKGELRHNPAHVVDIAPTLLELAQIDTQKLSENPSPPKAPGNNISPVFLKDGTVHPDYIWWFHEGNRAIRVGDWKLVAANGEPWELYNLALDRTETQNQASRFPSRVAELEQLFSRKMEEFKQIAAQETN